jgi:hypothetical protein
MSQDIHVDAITAHLQAVTDGRIKDLCICVPPGHAKSLIVSCFWPAWVWIDHPDQRFVFGSYSAGLSTRDSVRCRQIIESRWYQERWGDHYQLLSDQNEKTQRGFTLTAPALRLAAKALVFPARSRARSADDGRKALVRRADFIRASLRGGRSR